MNDGVFLSFPPLFSPSIPPFPVTAVLMMVMNDGMSEEGGACNFGVREAKEGPILLLVTLFLGS